MRYTMERLRKKLNRSVSYIRMIIGRFNIKKVKLKISGKIAYDIPLEQMKLIKEFNDRSQIHKSRNRKNN